MDINRINFISQFVAPVMKKNIKVQRDSKKFRRIDSISKSTNNTDTYEHSEDYEEVTYDLKSIENKVKKK